MDVRLLGALALLACGGPPTPGPAPIPLDWTAESGLAKRVAADQACARGASEACWWLGLERRWSEPRDRAGAWAAWSRACDQGHVLACEAAAVESTDPKARQERYARGCALGQRSACLGPRSLDWGCQGEACVAACEAGVARACTWVGREGQGELASATLWKACDGDDPWGCLILADRVAAGGPNPSGKPLDWLYNQVCDIQLDYGCVTHVIP